MWNPIVFHNYKLSQNSSSCQIAHILFFTWVSLTPALPDLIFPSFPSICKCGKHLRKRKYLFKEYNLIFLLYKQRVRWATYHILAISPLKIQIISMYIFPCNCIYFSFNSHKHSWGQNGVEFYLLLDTWSLIFIWFSRCCFVFITR